MNGADASHFTLERVHANPPRAFRRDWLDVKVSRLLPRIWEQCRPVTRVIPRSNSDGLLGGRGSGDLPPAVCLTGSVLPRVETGDEMAKVSRIGPPSGMRILVAHNVPRAPTGGMNRIMGFIPDRVARDGHIVDEFTADDATGYARRRWDRFGFPSAVYRHVREAHRMSRGYDIDLRPKTARADSLAPR